MIDKLQSLISEATDLRFADQADGNGPLCIPDPDMHPQVFMRELHRVRAVLDRVEQIYIDLERYRRTVRSAHDALNSEIEQDLSEELVRIRSNPMQSRQYDTGRERVAEAEIRVFPKRIRLRELKVQWDEAEQAFSVVRVVRDSLNGMRQDLSTVLRGLQFESSLER